jgi:hypothetical protein
MLAALENLDALVDINRTLESINFKTSKTA